MNCSYHAYLSEQKLPVFGAFEEPLQANTTLEGTLYKTDKKV